jgi:3',5'-cyclic AMP phosphodiesterase CpdA
LAGLLKLVQDEGLRADILVCPGDLADQAQPAAIQYSWQAMQTLRDSLGGPPLLATTGNHDVDSRYLYSSYNPRRVLSELTPPYPVPTASQADIDKYWSRHYSVIESTNWRLVGLNSSAHHGGALNEIERGRVGDETIANLNEELAGSEVKPVNILVCHHHPHQHMEIGLGEDDVMRNGQLLLDLLGRARLGRWLVIHGHKHHPKITYASGSATSPVVLAAGSLSACLYPALGTVARNQFYMLTLPFEEFESAGFVGTGEAWDWAHGTGWIRASETSGLPPTFGFGYRRDPVLLAGEIAATIGLPKCPWSTVTDAHPGVRFLLPQDFRTLQEALEAKHGLTMQWVNGAPREIGSTL